ncbi:MAG: hypothetical protein HY306_08865 [Nitrosomonadales bacterium]|nr:hypothetical protein [Nitrosomonadales bacterium]
MAISIQPVAVTGGAATISPLYLWGSMTQTAQARFSAQAVPSFIATLNSGYTVPVTYDAISALQNFFSPAVPASGLNIEQQRDLAAALGVNVQAGSSGVLNAINTLLMPANASGALINELVGAANAAAAEASPAISGLYNGQGVIEGVPGDSISQARDAVLATLLGTGAGPIENIPNPVTGSTSGATENPFAAVAGGTATTLGSVQTAGAAEANAGISTSAATTAAPTAVTENPVTVLAAEATAVQPVVLAASLPVTTGAGVIVATGIAGTLVATQAAAPVATTPATVIAETAAVTIPVVNTEVNARTAATVSATIVPTATPPIAEPVAVTQATQNLVAVQALEATVLPAVETVVNTATQATVVVATTGQPVVAASPTPVPESLPEAVTVASIVPVTTTTSAVPVATSANLPATPIRFDNAASVLQSLLADAAAHAYIVSNPAAIYSVGGAMFQMGMGADHVWQTAMRGNLPDIRGSVRSVYSSARARGALERQT